MSPAPDSRFRSGLVFGLAAYLLWGFLPLYFLLMAPVGPFEIVAGRILFSLVFCALLLTVTRGWRAFAAVVRQPRLLFLMGLAGLLIYVNWQTYVAATLSGHLVEGSLGYFINPIVTVLLGVLVLRERLRLLQWVAVGISFAACVVLGVGYGAVPWIALVLAFSFGLYGLVKKHVGPSVDAISGLTLETAWLAPVAVVQLVIVANTVGLVAPGAGPLTLGLVAFSGVVTAVPLLLFASATRRMPLVWVGFLQFIAPLLMFGIGVFVLHEDMPPVRWLGFAIVWLAVLVLVVDMVRGGRDSRVTELEAPESPIG